MFRRIRSEVRSLRTLRGQLGVMGALKYRSAEMFGRSVVHLVVHGCPVWIRPGTPDLLVALTSLGREFEPLGQLLDPDFDGLIVDAGGYIGTAAIKLARLYPAATVVSIEPSAGNFEILRLNTAGKERIEAIQAALTPVAGGRVSLNDRGTGEWGFTTVEKPNDCAEAPTLQEIETTSLEEIATRCRGREIGLLKLDIEGAEKALFEEASTELARIPVIFVELHDRIVDDCSKSFDVFSQHRSVQSFGGEKFLSLAC